MCAQLLQELCTVFNVDLPCRVKSSQLGIIGNKQSGGTIVTPQPSSCSYICQHCLVHLGDIGETENLHRLSPRLLAGQRSSFYPLSVFQHGTATRPARQSRTTDMPLSWSHQTVSPAPGPGPRPGSPYAQSLCRAGLITGLFICDQINPCY